MRAFVFVYIIEKVARAHVQNTHLESVVLVNTWARSRVQALELYLMIDIHANNSIHYPLCIVDRNCAAMATTIYLFSRTPFCLVLIVIIFEI